MGRGAEGVHIVSMVKALESLGHIVEIVSPPSVDLRKEAGCNVFKLDQQTTSPFAFVGRILKFIAQKAPQAIFELFELFYNLYAFLSIRRAVNRFHLDMVYERYAFFSFICGFIAKQKKLPFILEVNEISGIKRFRGQSLVRLTTWIEKKIFENADLITVVSSFLKKSIVARGITADKILVLPNGVDLQKFSIDSLDSENTVREKYTLKKETIVIGFVGWFAEWDRLDKIIEIFAELFLSYPSSKLMLVGDGKIMPQLKEKAHKSGIKDHIIFTGPVSRLDVQKYISAFDISVLPHSNEFGSPIVLFEFMALGKPVVAPTLDPITDVIEDGKNGLLFPAGNFVELKHVLGKLLSDKHLREEIGQAARRDIVENHSWECKAEQVISALFKRKPLQNT